MSSVSHERAIWCVDGYMEKCRHEGKYALMIMGREQLYTIGQLTGNQSFYIIRDEFPLCITFNLESGDGPFH